MSTLTIIDNIDNIDNNDNIDNIDNIDIGSQKISRDLMRSQEISMDLIGLKGNQWISRDLMDHQNCIKKIANMPRVHI